MDKQKQIEEMTKDLGIAFQLTGTTRFAPVAEILVDKYSPTKQTRKETAEKFAERLKEKLKTDYINSTREQALATIDKICKELTEG